MKTRVFNPSELSGTVGVVVDLSGSMSPTDYEEVENICERLGEENIGDRVAGGDTHLVYPYKAELGNVKELFQAVREVQQTVGGGSEMGVIAWEAYAKQGMPDNLVLFTDGETPWPTAEKQVKVDGVFHSELPPGTKVVLIGQDYTDKILRNMPSYVAEVTYMGNNLDKGMAL